MPADAEHAAREEVGGSANDGHAHQRADKELHPAIRHVNLHQHRGQHEHQQDDKKRRQDPHVWRQPADTAHTKKFLSSSST